MPEGYPKELKTLGDHIRKVRIDRCLYQKSVAEQLCVTVEALIGWELNQHQPSIQILPTIRQFLGYWPESEPQTLDKKLLDYRRRTGLTQKSLAEKLQIDPGTLSRWERGLRIPAEKFKERIEHRLFSRQF